VQPRPPLPCKPLYTCLSLRAHTYAPLGRASLLIDRKRPFCRARPPLLYAPPSTACALLCHACPCAYPSHLCAPLPCVPPKYKFHEVVVHSITWASGPSTTERWLIAGCLGGDHSFYTYSQGHVHGCDCMHVKFHVKNLFIVNASRIRGHIKLLGSLYIF
jgi:hypothetical protein